MQLIDPFFKADATVVLAIALMVTASFHFLKTRIRSKREKSFLESYFAFCESFDNLLHFLAIGTVVAFGYSFGWMEMLKLVIVCLVFPVITHLFALVMGSKRWDIVAGIVAMPVALLCLWYVYPKLNWFGFF